MGEDYVDRRSTAAGFQFLWRSFRGPVSLDLSISEFGSVFEARVGPCRAPCSVEIFAFVIFGWKIFPFRIRILASERPWTSSPFPLPATQRPSPHTHTPIRNHRWSRKKWVTTDTALVNEAHENERESAIEARLNVMERRNLVIWEAFFVRACLSGLTLMQLIGKLLSEFVNQFSHLCTSGHIGAKEMIGDYENDWYLSNALLLTVKRR